MRFILDIEQQHEHTVAGRVQAENSPESKPFTGWLELLAFLEQPNETHENG